MLATCRTLLLSSCILLICYFSQTLYLFQFGRWNQVAVWLPYLLLPLSALFASQFNQNRLALFAVSCLFFASFLPLVLAQLELTPALNSGLAFTWLILTGFYLCLRRESGLFNRKGLMQVTILLIPIAIFFALAKLNPELLTQVVLWQTLDNDFISLFVLISCFAFVLVNLVKSGWQQNPIESNFSIMLLCCWFYHLLAPNQPLQAICLSSIAIILIVTTLSHSYQLAYFDELTKLPSRRALNRYAMTLGRKYILVMADVDHFKQFNDTYGHDVGDQVLKLVASRLGEVSSGGKAYRYGGEEFTLVFANKTPTQVVPELERLRQSIANYDMVVRDKSRPKKSEKDRNAAPANATKTVNVTISMGYALRSKELNDFDKCLKAADEALYRAKKAGRNCVSD
ncbi:GGDEF domain-containing protein [Catenovulum maritimum]|uniref:GGDEF domain-containing protein n=1 Tax=Catenovulum maritimum TaxID=1513271 RepID=UPI0006611946|nr:GGDEF domain-containing protein [Catenovulum maritimum]